MGSEQPAGDRIDFRISDRCSCRGRNCRAHTPVGGDKAENILQRGGYSEVCGRPVVRLSERSGCALRSQSSGEGDEEALELQGVLCGGDRCLP